MFYYEKKIIFMLKIAEKNCVMWENWENLVLVLFLLGGNKLKEMFLFSGVFLESKLLIGACK